MTEASAAAILDHLDECGVAVEIGPVQRNGAKGAMTSIYCRDPDGDLIEIATDGAGTSD